jgi:hypothetical protein
MTASSYVIRETRPTRDGAEGDGTSHPAYKAKHVYLASPTKATRQCLKPRRATFDAVGRCRARSRPASWSPTRVIRASD